MKKCCLCGKRFHGYGHNPAPLKRHGRCCDSCNADVITVRFLGKEKPGKSTTANEIAEYIEKYTFDDNDNVVLKDPGFYIEVEYFPTEGPGFRIEGEGSFMPLKELLKKFKITERRLNEQ